MPVFNSASCPRARLSQGLIAAAILGGVTANILAFVVLISGTAVVKGRDDDGQSSLLLKDLALVSFDGIIANSETTEFLVHLHWFVSAFAWEHPTAPGNVSSVGFAYKGPGFSPDMMDNLRSIAAELGLPRESWRCPRPGPQGDPCPNEFFEAWRSFAMTGSMGFAPWIIWVMLFSSIALCIVTISQEWMIRYKPHWMKCRCLILKRWCPFPKGTREEIEKMDEHAWDKVQFAFWGLLALYFLLPAAHASFICTFFLRFLGYLEERLPEGLSMNPRRGRSVEMLLWAAFALSASSAVCIALKRWLSKRSKGWMEEQDLGHIPESHLDTGQGSADGGRDGNPSRYTD